MNGNPYRVLGPIVPPMHGRAQLFERLVRHLTKLTPDHVSVVGPSHFGKSVLLRHTANAFGGGREGYVTAAYWDLRHDQTPTSDAEFLRGFAATLLAALSSVGSEHLEYIDTASDTLRDDLALVLDEMAKAKQRVVVTMDGFDAVLARPAITKSTWDTLRSFAQKTSLRLVTGSRQRLRELCRTEASQTSDFWEVFYPNPLVVGRFEDGDWDGFLEPFATRRVTIDGSARKELKNWTGGFPVLAAAVAEQLYDEAPDGATVRKEDVDRVCDASFERCREILRELWDDCTQEMKADLAELQRSEELFADELHADRRRELDQRGYVKVAGKSVGRGSALMGRFAKEQSGGVESLGRLFGEAARYETNVQSLLELRLAQVLGPDAALRVNIQKAIRDLDNPESSLVWFRSISDRALQLIWDRELGPSRIIPADWINDWKFAGVTLNIDAKGNLPASRGAQCNLLRVMTGTDRAKPVAKYITKTTALLVDSLQSVGDFGQHQDGHPVSRGFAAAACLSAIELCSCLTADLTRNRSAT